MGIRYTRDGEDAAGLAHLAIEVPMISIMVVGLEETAIGLGRRGKREGGGVMTWFRSERPSDSVSVKDRVRSISEVPLYRHGDAWLGPPFQLPTCPALARENMASYRRDAPPRQSSTIRRDDRQGVSTSPSPHKRQPLTTGVISLRNGSREVRNARQICQGFDRRTS